MSTRFAAALASALALLSCTTAWSAQKKLDQTFNVAPGGKLTIDADGGEITVTGTDTRQVVVRVVVTGSQHSLDEMTLSAQQTANDVVVTARHQSGSWLERLWSDRNLHTVVNVEVPRQYDADLRTSGGDLTTSGLQGTIAGTTSGGNIRVSKVRGPVTMRTSGGDVVIEEIAGNVQLRTSGGDIVARGIDGDIDLKTSGGDIRATAIDGSIRAHTSGGNISAALVGANRGIDVTTSGGSIELRLPGNISATLNASTSGGSVRSDLPVTTTRTRESRLSGTINGGGPEIVARTSGGDIELNAST